MKTVDGVEIKVGDELCNVNGEILRVEELFPEETGKLVVTPLFLVESMYVTGDGGYHQEVNTECEFEAEKRVVKCDEVFMKAPHQRLTKDIEEKKKELEEYALKIGTARIEFISQKEKLDVKLGSLTSEIKALEDKKTKIVADIGNIIDNARRIYDGN